MEPTSSPDNARQSRGLARFWPVHGMPAPAQRHSDEDPEDAGRRQPDQQVSGPARGVALRLRRRPPRPRNWPRRPAGEDALTSETQMVALGSRRGFDVSNGARAWTGNQGGFPPVGSVPSATPPGTAAARSRTARRSPGHRSPCRPPRRPRRRPAEQQAPRPPFAGRLRRTHLRGAVSVPAGLAVRAARAPAPPARPTENVRGIPLGASAGPGGGDGQRPPSGEPSRGAASVPVSGRRRSADEDVDADEQARTGRPTPSRRCRRAAERAGPPGDGLGLGADLRCSHRLAAAPR